MLKPDPTLVLAHIKSIAEYYKRNSFANLKEYNLAIQQVKDLARSVLPEYAPYENPHVYGCSETGDFAFSVDCYISFLTLSYEAEPC